MNSVVSTTVVVVVSSNVAMAQSSELLWGFINTLQIMYFFPVLNLKFPDHLSSILNSFASAKLQFPIPYIDSIKNSDFFISKVDSLALNERWQTIQYESTSILVNGVDFVSMIFQGTITCILVFALKAWLITLHGDKLNIAYEQESEVEDNEKNNKEIDYTGLNRKERLALWAKKKIREISLDYKYNFFLRIGIEMYLEIVVLSMLNMRHYKQDNIYQIISLGLSIFALCLSQIFLLWSLHFSCKNYSKYKHKERIDIQ